MVNGVMQNAERRCADAMNSRYTWIVYLYKAQSGKTRCERVIAHELQ
jgi:hypothetical protein